MIIIMDQDFNQQYNNDQNTQQTYNAEPYNPNGYNQNGYNSNGYNPYGNMQPTQQPGYGLAITSLVCGILGFFCCGVILGIVAIVTGIIAKDKGYKGAMATVGFVLGIISLILCLALTVITLADPEFLNEVLQIKYW